MIDVVVGFCNVEMCMSLTILFVKWQYLNPASLHDPSLNDVEGYHILEQSMDKIGLMEAEKANLFHVVAAVLHLGNITFEENLNDKKGTETHSACKTYHYSCS